MKDVLFLRPRLDCTFKAGPCPIEMDKSVPLPPIRKHWDNFAENMKNVYDRPGVYNYREIELPLWQFTPELVNDLAPDICFIPHKQNYQFKIDEAKTTPQYYMQTVFPWLFTVDKSGWGADSHQYKNWFTYQMGEENPEVNHFNLLKDRANSNESKFSQPLNKFDQSGYVLFVCQIPHDEVIKYHSSVDVPTALEFTLRFCREADKFCVVKGHPVNPGSMIALKEIQKKYQDVSVWVDDFSIHSLIKQSESVFLVNSGVGFEALLHEKPVYCYGQVEYDCVINKVKCLEIDYLMQTYNTEVSVTNYKKFINRFVSLCHDTTRR